MSSSIPLIKYPIDWTGERTSNLAHRVNRTLGAQTGRAFVPEGGPFFVNSAKVYNALTGVELRRDQYMLLHPLESASNRAGQPIACVIYINDRNVGTEVSYTVNHLGGEYSWATNVIEQALMAIDIDNRPVRWGDLLDIPTSFNPAPHLHDIGDTYGWEYILAEMVRIRDAILMGDAQSHEELRRQYMGLIAALRSEFSELENIFHLHLNDRNNPHGVDAEDVGLGNVQNYGVASDPEATAGAVSNKYITPRGVSLYVNSAVIPLINNHINNKNNPHVVTAAQVGAYTRAQVDTLIAGRLASNGTAVDSTKLAGRTWTEVFNQVRANLNASLVTAGTFTAARLGSGSATATAILAGGATARWVEFGTMFDQYSRSIGMGKVMMAGNVVNYGQNQGHSYSQGLAIISNTYIDSNRFPAGTLVVFKGTYWDQVGTSNGSRWEQFAWTAMVARLPNLTWERLIMNDNR